MAKYRVVRKDRGRDNPHTGTVSTHHTYSAAAEAVAAANRVLRAQPGCANAWHPYEIQRQDPATGEWSRAEDEPTEALGRIGDA